MPVNGSTEVYGILGNPVSHSLSPALHNAAFEALNLNKIYIPIPGENVSASIDGMKAMGIKGASVTIPHKQAVIPFLDSIDPVADKIGAVNTLLFRDGKIHGCNTDWIGANRALSEKTELSGKKVLLLGAGGSAKALGFGFLEAGAEVIVSNRTETKGRNLADQLSTFFVPLTSVGDIHADILVNATSVGMTPDVDKTPVEQGFLQRFQVVMDIIYAPQKTRLLREAEDAGCDIINGLAMLLYQGMAQFELWTGKEAPAAVMQKQLLTGLEKK